MADSAGSASASCTKATSRREGSAAASASALSPMIVARSFADLTMIGTSILSCAAIAADISVAIFAGVFLVERNTTLPLLSSVATSV